LDPAHKSMVQAIEQFMVVINACHPVQMQFLTAIRPLARDKGPVWHIGKSGYYFGPQNLYLQNVPGKVPKDFGGRMGAITVSTVKPVATENPFKPRLAAFHLEPRPGEWPWVEMGIDVLDQASHNYWGIVTHQDMTKLD